MEDADSSGGQRNDDGLVGAKVLTVRLYVWIWVRVLS